MSKKMITVTKNGSQLEKLENLSELLAKQIDKAIENEEKCGPIAKLSKEYRETVKQIADIKGDDYGETEIDRIIAKKRKRFAV